MGNSKKLTSKDLENIVKTKTNHDVIYLGVFVDNENQKIKPAKHVFLDMTSEKIKIYSVDEQSIIKYLL